MISLSTPVNQLYMVGPTYAAALKRIGIETIEDILYHFPFRYQDYSQVTKISLLQQGETVTIVGAIKSFKNIFTRRRFILQKAIISDETGEIECIWYNQKFLSTVLKPGRSIAISGKVSFSAGKYIFESPDYELVRDTAPLIHTAHLVAIYPETRGISSKWIRSRIASILHTIRPEITEFVPSLLLDQYNLLPLSAALEKIHFPANTADITAARERLAFDELFLIQLAASVRKNKWKQQSSPFQFDTKQKSKLRSFIQNLPFTLTDAQTCAVEEIIADMSRKVPMNRLLEGDVGSGKTVVAAIALYACCLSKHQAALMAPTEILAKQQYEAIRKFFAPYRYKIGFFSSSSKQKDDKKLDILIGTHSLLSLKKQFSKLGLAVIDEQQRFGVEQRATLREKGTNPHVLTMTATPIPRTIALTLYGDLDMSIIDMMPQGRRRVKTWVVPPHKRDAAYGWIRQQIQDSDYQHQAFIICPLIEESENLTSVKAAKVEYERLQKDIFPDLRIGLLHGKLKPKEKACVLQDFLEKKYTILVATALVEVGIDIPSATIMMIEAADRFGLAQIHQLRGRVGRSDVQSFCLLFTQAVSDHTMKRLQLLETIYNGPKLAEYDLKLRGAGQLYGVRQHGRSDLKLADLSDTELIQKTGQAAKTIIQQSFQQVKYPHLREKLQNYIIQSIAPD